MRPERWRSSTASVLFPLIPVLLGVLLYSPFFARGVPNTADGLLHLYRTVLWSDAWSTGDWWPRWHTLLYQGYGYPLFNFYAPLLYVVSSAFSFVAQNATVGLKIALLLTCIAYPLGAWLWARDVYGRVGAVVAAAAYAFAAFRFRELFIQGNYAQFAAWAIYPWLFFTWRRLAVAPGRMAFAGAVAATVALLLLHNISAMLVAPALGVYVLWQAIEHRQSQPWLRLILAGLCALLVGMVFWLPALYESALTRVTVLTRGYFDVAGHFLTLDEILAPMIAIDERAANPILPYNAGRVLLLLGFAGALFVLRPGVSRRVRGHLLFATVATLISGFMMLEVSLPVWRTVPYIAFAEFPSRLYGVGSLCAALLAGAFTLWFARWPRAQAIAALLAVFALIVEVAAYQFPRTFLPITVTIDNFHEYEMGYSALGTTSASEYLSLWTRELPKDEVFTEEGERRALIDPPDGVEGAIEEATAQTLRMRVEAERPTTVALAQFYFPGWSVSVDDAPTKIGPCTPLGLICLRVPAGASLVEAVYRGTSAQYLGMGLALVGVALPLVVLAFGPMHAQPAKISAPEVSSHSDEAIDAEGDAAPLGAAASLLTLIGVILIVKVLWIAPHTRLFRTASPAGQVVHAQHKADLPVGSSLRLLGWDLPEASVRQGSSLPLRLYWQANAPIDEEYSSFAQLIGGSEQQEFAGASTVHPGNMPTTSWNPDYYVIDDQEIAIPEDAPPIVYTLRVGMSLRGQQQRIGEQDLTTRVRVLPAQEARVDETAHAIDASFDGGPRLVGYEIGALKTLSTTGETLLPVTLFWKAGEEQPAALQIFVHAVDENGNLVTQSDSAAYDGLYPVTDWLPGEVVRDARTLVVPAGAEVKDLRVGLYDPVTLQRAPVSGENGLVVVDQALQIPLAPTP